MTQPPYDSSDSESSTANDFAQMDSDDNSAASLARELLNVLRENDGTSTYHISGPHPSVAGSEEEGESSDSDGDNSSASNVNADQTYRDLLADALRDLDDLDESPGMRNRSEAQSGDAMISLTELLRGLDIGQADNDTGDDDNYVAEYIIPRDPRLPPPPPASGDFPTINAPLCIICLESFTENDAIVDEEVVGLVYPLHVDCQRNWRASRRG